MKPRSEVRSSSPANHASVAQRPWAFASAPAPSRSAKSGWDSGFHVICTSRISAPTIDTPATKRGKTRSAAAWSGIIEAFTKAATSQASTASRKIAGARLRPDATAPSAMIVFACRSPTTTETAVMTTRTITMGEKT